MFIDLFPQRFGMLEKIEQLPSYTIFAPVDIHMVRCLQMYTLSYPCIVFIYDYMIYTCFNLYRCNLIFLVLHSVGIGEHKTYVII